jgi:4-methylaminobutanoate oxidase (formaldehyde-forming)
MSYVGGPGFELYVPVEMATHAYDALVEAGAASGLADAGYWAIDALRIEAGRRAWGAELGPDETPLEAGLMHAVKLDRPGFVGREALLAQRAEGPRKRLALVALEDPQAWCWGGEGILRDGQAVGEVTSAGWSVTLGRGVAMGYVRADRPIDRDFVLAGRYEVDIAGTRVAARALARPPFAG